MHISVVLQKSLVWNYATEYMTHFMTAKQWKTGVDKFLNKNKNRIFFPKKWNVYKFMTFGHKSFFPPKTSFYIRHPVYHTCAKITITEATLHPIGDTVLNYTAQFFTKRWAFMSKRKFYTLQAQYVVTQLKKYFKKLSWRPTSVAKYANLLLNKKRRQNRRWHNDWVKIYLTNKWEQTRILQAKKNPNPSKKKSIVHKK